MATTTMASMRSMRSAFSRLVRFQQQHYQESNSSNSFLSILTGKTRNVLTVEWQSSTRPISISYRISAINCTSIGDSTSLPSTSPPKMESSSMDIVGYQIPYPYGSASSMSLTSPNRMLSDMSFVLVMPVNTYQIMCAWAWRELFLIIPSHFHVNSIVFFFFGQFFGYISLLQA